MRTTLKEILKQKDPVIHTVLPHESVLSCILKMAELKIGALLVIEQGQLVGIFSERDVVNKAFHGGLDLKNTAVQNLMTTEIIYATLNTTVEEAMATFTRYRFRHLPILDKGVLLGLVSSGDVTKWLITHQQKDIQFLTDYITGDNHYQ